MARLLFTLPFALCLLQTAAQQTVIKRDGSQVHGRITGTVGDRLHFIDQRIAASELACSDLLCVVDESLILHNHPCSDTGVGNSLTRNCDALVGADQRVTKGRITRWLDDRYVVRTKNGESIVPRADVVGVVSSGHVEFNLPPERLRKLIGDNTVVGAMNNFLQCPNEAPTKPVEYSESWVKPKFAKAVAKAHEPRAPSEPPVPRGLSADLDFDRFKDVALEKTKRLSQYIGQIADKSVSAIAKDKAVEQAIGLFEREDNLVHVSNVTTGTEKTHTVRNYLATHLRFLKYDRVDIEWADIQYASDFELQPDGSYTAIISLQQRFTGTIDGRTYYSDVTNKNVQIKLRTYEKVVEGRTERLWDVFLADIGVTATKAE